MATRAQSCNLASTSGVLLDVVYVYRWSKEFLEAGKQRLAGDTARAATSDEVKEPRREASALKEVVAEPLKTPVLRREQGGRHHHRNRPASSQARPKADGRWVNLGCHHFVIRFLPWGVDCAAG
jgi:hypothetical protein